jgi:CRP-like cAMP-binding protein
MHAEHYHPDRTKLRGPTAATQGLLARVPPFSSASPEARASFAASARRIVLSGDDRAWRAGDPSFAFAFIARGIIKLVRPRFGGRADILGIFGPGEALGIVAAMRGVPFATDAVGVTRESEVVQIPRTDVLDVAAREPAFALAIAQACAARAASMRELNAILSAGGVEARLAALVLYLAERFGDIDDEAMVRIPVVLTRAELASCISTSPETVIRIMSRWAAAQVLETGADGFLIRSQERLRELAEPPSMRSRRGPREEP